MRSTFLRPTLILVLCFLALLFVFPSLASAASCVSEGNESWNGGFACDSSPNQTPTSADSVTVLADHTIILDTNPVYGSLAVAGTLATGSASCDFGGRTVTIDGTFRIDQGGFASNGTFSYGLAGALEFANTSGPFELNNNHVFWPTAHGPVDVVVSGAGGLNMNTNRTVAGTLRLADEIVDGSYLTVNGVVQIDTGGFFSNSGPIYGSGSTLKYNSGGFYGRNLEWNSTSGAGYPANVQISNNTTLNLGAYGGQSTARQLAGNLTIDAGSTLSMNQTDEQMQAHLAVLGDIDNAGELKLSDLSGGDLHLYGDLNNTGTLTLFSRTVYFYNNGAQTVSGAGSWSGTGGVYISTHSITSLASDVTMALSQFDVYGTLSLSNYTLTLNPTGVLSFNNYATVNGSGTFRTYGTVTLNAGNTFNPLVNVASGTTTAYGTLQGAVAVTSGAVLQVSQGNTLSAYGNVTVNGTLSGSNAYLYFYSSTFTNNGTISVPHIFFYGSSTQTLVGTGAWTGVAHFYISNNVTVALGNDLAPQGIASFTNYGTFTLGSQTFTLSNATFNNSGTVNGSGTFQTSGAVTLYAGGTFNPPLSVTSGTTTASGTINAAITVASGATLQVSQGSTLSAFGNVTVDGALSGGSAYFDVYGATLTNNGTISVPHIFFYGSSTQTLVGTGAWTGVAHFYISNNVTVALGNDLAPQGIASYTNYGTFTLGSQTFTLSNATFNNSGTVNGSGTFQTSGAVTLYAGSTFNPPLSVTSGTTTAYGSFNAAITVASGAVLQIAQGSTLSAYGNVTVNGTLSGEGAYLYFYGPTLTNSAGATVSASNVDFYGNSAAQTIAGSGAWIGAGRLYVSYSSAISLANDVSMAFSQYYIAGGGSFSLAGRTLTLNPADTLTFTNYGTFDIGSQSLAFHAPGNATFNNSGTVNGSGTFQTSGAVTLYAGSTFNPPLSVTSGTTTAYGSFNAAITVASGAVLQIAQGSTLSAYGNVTVNGTLSGEGAYLYFYGATLTNSAGATVSISNVDFYGHSGTQTIAGSGAWTGTGRLYVSNSSAVSLANDVSMAFSQYYIVGSFSLADRTLTLNPADTLTFTNYGTFDIGSQMLAFHAPGNATFNNYATVNGSGTFQTSAVVTLYAGGTFNPPLSVTSGTTTAYGSFNAAITVASGAVLQIAQGSTLSAYGNVTVNGTLSGEGAYLYFYGATLTNNGSSVTVATVYFPSGAHTVLGTGSFTGNTASILYGATVTLGSNHRMSTVEIHNGGTFDLDGHTLSLSSPETPLVNNGTFDTTESTVVYNGSTRQTVATSNVVYHSLGIDNAAGVTLDSPVTVPGALILTNGHLTLGNHTLTLGDAATIGGAPSAEAMVVADSNGYLKKTSPAGALVFTLPIGDASGNYTPVSLNCTSFQSGEVAEARLRAVKHPAMPGANYLARYWTLNSNATNAGCTAVFSYVQGDVVGDEALLRPARYDGSAWTLLGAGAVDVNANTLSGTFDSFSDFSAGEGSALGVNLASFTAEQTDDSILVSWETANELDNRGFNLYRGLSPTEPDRQLNTSLIPSQSQGNPAGFLYTWVDTVDLVYGTTYYYWLEDLDIYGVLTRHGPISVTFVQPTAVIVSGMQANAAGEAPASWWALVGGLALLGGVALVVRRRQESIS